MGTSKILWVDFRFSRNQVSDYHYLSKVWATFCIKKTEGLDLEMRKPTPKLICFEYDYPDTSGLSALRQARYLLPSTPIIMLTEQHSEELAIWALRLQVWDYFIKPIKPKDLVTSATTILAQKAPTKNKTPQLSRPYLSILPNYIPTEFRSRSSQQKRTYRAHTFVEKHYHEKIYAEVVARHCGMNASTFSRYFKKEYEMNFRDYLINYRIHKARKLLQKPNTTMADIAYTVGFNDPSYFTRMFRRIVGTSPSHYHETHKTL